MPSLKRPPSLGAEAEAGWLNKAGDRTAAAPSAETRAIKSLRVILPVDNRCLNSLMVLMVTSSV